MATTDAWPVYRRAICKILFKAFIKRAKYDLNPSIKKLEVWAITAGRKEATRLTNSECLADKDVAADESIKKIKETAILLALEINSGSQSASQVPSHNRQKRDVGIQIPAISAEDVLPQQVDEVQVGIH